MSIETSQSQDEAAVRKLAQTYFDALYDGRVDLFEAIFHPAAMLYCFTEAQPVIMTTEQYFQLVDGRASPASRGDPRFDEIVSLEIPTPATAHLRVRDAYLPKRFTDELGLVKTAGEWRIVSKIWHFTIS